MYVWCVCGVCDVCDVCVVCNDACTCCYIQHMEVSIGLVLSTTPTEPSKHEEVLGEEAKVRQGCLVHTSPYPVVETS